MICPKCENKIKAKPKKTAVNYSPMFLHDEVIVDNAKCYTCEHCEFSFTDLGNTDQIDLQIASKMLEQDQIKRSQLAWIRRSLLKLSIIEMCYLMGCHARFWIDLENFKAVMPEVFSGEIKRLIEKHLASRRLLITKKAQKIELQLW